MAFSLNRYRIRTWRGMVLQFKPLSHLFHFINLLFIIAEFVGVWGVVEVFCPFFVVEGELFNGIDGVN